MVAIRPQTDIILLKVPLQLNQEHQLNFANATAQFNYFNSLPKLTEYNATYQRKDNTIRYGANFEDLVGYNYVMYRNEAYGNKWFYAFIDNMEYINDNMTALSIRTDVYQTWQFDIQLQRTFVEREHTNDDTAGANTVPESIETGDYEIVDLRNSPMYEDTTRGSFCVCFAVTKLPNNATTFNGEGNTIGGVYNSLHFFGVHTFADAREIIRGYDNDNTTTSDAIVNVYMIPRLCLDRNNDNGSVASTGQTPTAFYGRSVYPIYDSVAPDTTYQLQQPTALSGNYTPVNKKLYSYPYSYVYVTNNAGESVTYNWEDFPMQNVGGTTGRTINYRKAFVPSASVSAKLWFTNYKERADGAGYGDKLYSYGINYAKVPVCAWTTDYYTNWLTQNGVNIAVQTISGVASGIATMATGGAGIAQGAISAGTAIGNTIGQLRQAETTPPQAHGDIATGDFTYAYSRNSISFYMMSVRPEMARVIDNYFSMYGYATHRVKIPNVTGRRNWNYVKTIGCYLRSTAPQADIQELEQMFNNGVTIWHNPATFMDYSQANPIV